MITHCVRTLTILSGEGRGESATDGRRNKIKREKTAKTTIMNV